MGKDFILSVFEDSESAQLVSEVFGRLDVYVQSPYPELVYLGEMEEPQLVYMLDLRLITPDERVRLVNRIAAKFDADPVEVDSHINNHSIPIRANDCVLRVENPSKWID